MADVDCFRNPLECASDAVVSGAVENLAEALKAGAKELIETSIGWWLKVDAIELSSSPAVEIRGWTLYIAMALAVGGAMWALTQSAYRRRAEPVWDAGGGLLRVAAVAGMTGAGGFILPQLLMNAVDSFSEYVLSEAVNDRIVEMTAMTGISSPGLVILLSIILIVIGAIQAVLMFLREGAIVVLSGLLVLAAAGGMATVTRSWWSKLTGLLLSLIFYKAMAALVWGTALAFLDTRGSENPVRSFFVGVTMFVLSIVALGPMTKFFSWGVSSVGGGGGGLLAAAGMGAYALSQRGGGAVASGPSPSQHASTLRNDLGPPSGGSAPTGAAATLRSSGGGSSGAPAGGPAAGAAMVIAAATAAKNRTLTVVTGGDVE